MFVVPVHRFVQRLQRIQKVVKIVGFDDIRQVLNQANQVVMFFAQVCR